MKLKKHISAFLCALTIFTVGCGNDGNKEQSESYVFTPPSYDYEMEDIVKEGFFDVESLYSIEPRLELAVEKSDNLNGYMIDGMPYGSNTCRAFFWVGKPSGEMPEGGWPAVVLIHGGGGNAMADWVSFWNDNGYVALSLDLNGQMFDINSTLVPNSQFYSEGSWGSTGSKTDENSFKRSWTYMNICNLILCHNYLRDLEYVNPDKTFATGISWGGYLTCVLAGVDKRFQGFAPVYGCGSMHTDSWLFKVQGNEAAASVANEWATVYDPTAYLPYATKPMLFVTGMTDHAFSAVSQKRSTSLVPGKVFFNYSSSLDHGHYYYITPGIKLFFEHLMNKNQPVINFMSAEVKDGKFRVECETDVESATFSYTTTDHPDSHLWRWTNEQISLKKGLNKIDIPEGSVAVLVSGNHDDYYYSIASTDVFILKDMSEVY